MKETFEQFLLKVNSRKNAVKNSWKADEEYFPSEGKPIDNMTEEIFSQLNTNLNEANAARLINPYFEIYSSKKVIGPVIVFFKRCIRKTTRLLWGWLYEPHFVKANHYRGKIVNAVSIEKDLLYGLYEQNRHLKAEQIINEKRIAELGEALEDIKVRLSETELQLSKTELQLSETKSQLSETELLNAKVRSRLEKTDEKVTETQNYINSLTGRTNDIEEYIRLTSNKMDDDFYHDFEETFRGSVEMIRNRIGIYVPIIKEHLPDWSSATFVDVGSGRGEWLDILRNNGATDYVGVDLNERQNKICEENGHKTVCMDCVEYIDGLQENSVDLISGFQIIEHLPLEMLIKLLKSSFRVLKPGGMILFETPNPQNLIVSADTFYIDPSHIRHLNPYFTEYIVKYCGFSDVSIIPANSCPNWAGVDASTLPEELADFAKKFNDVNFMLYGPQDYSVFARKEV